MFEPHRVIHRNQILATGVTGPEITEMVAMGTLIRLWRGFYTTGAAIGLPDPRGVTRSMRVVLSHQSAAAWCGVDLLEGVERLHVTAPLNRGRRSDSAPGVHIHRANLDASDIVTIRGVRVTTPNRTIVDVARSASLEAAVCMADGYLRRHLTTQSSLRHYARSLAGRGRPAAVKVADLADARSASVFESVTRVLLVRARLPSPTTQYTVRDSDGRWIGRVDFAWPEFRLVLECDGFEHHSSRDAFNRDRRRWNALSRVGWRVAVVTWHDVISDPSYVVDLVAGYLAG
jgi:very-short-patch-repair endonuclease